MSISARRALRGLVAVGALVACGPALAPVASPTPRPTAPVSGGAPRSPANPVAMVAAPAPSEPTVASDAVAESLLVDVTTVDTTIRVDLRYATRYNFTGAVLPGYEGTHALLRREAAAALGRVQQRLAVDGLGLKIFDGYRPVRATDAMVAWTRRVNREDLLRDGYIAEKSRHNLGLAVDLTAIELATGRELKMGTAFDTFSATAHTANATGEYATNRQRLKRAMEAEGFANLAEEWWHFSFDVANPMRFDLVIH